MRFRPAFLAIALLAAPAAADDSAKWGAIAYGGAPQWVGTAVDYPTAADARQAALDACGRQCSQTMVFQRICGAVAASSTGASGWARNRWRHRATARALADCRKRGGDCTVVAWACTAH